MKIIKEKKIDHRTVTLRISEETMKRIDVAAKKGRISRQKLIEAILNQVMADKDFVVRIEE